VEGLSVQDVGTLKNNVYAVMEAELRKQNAAWISKT
jgi:hypothetical protein